MELKKGKRVSNSRKGAISGQKNKKSVLQTHSRVSHLVSLELALTPLAVM